MPDPWIYSAQIAVHRSVALVSKYTWWDEAHTTYVREHHGPIQNYYIQQSLESDHEPEDYCPAGWDLDYYTDGSENGVWA